MDTTAVQEFYSKLSETEQRQLVVLFSRIMNAHSEVVDFLSSLPNSDPSQSETAQYLAEGHMEIAEATLQEASAIVSYLPEGADQQGNDESYATERQKALGHILRVKFSLGDDASEPEQELDSEKAQAILQALLSSEFADFTLGNGGEVEIEAEGESMYACLPLETLKQVYNDLDATIGGLLSLSAIYENNKEANPLFARFAHLNAKMAENFRDELQNLTGVLSQMEQSEDDREEKQPEGCTLH